MEDKAKSLPYYTIWTNYLGLKCLALGIIFISASVFLHLYYDEPYVKFIEKLTEHIGVAILIAVLVGWTIDRVHKKELTENFTYMLDSFKENAFSSVYNWSIPRIFLDAIQEQMFTCGIIRNNWDVTYTLRDFTEEEKVMISNFNNEYPFCRRIAVDTVVEGIIENISTNTIKMPMNFFLEKEDAAEFNRCTSMNIAEINGDFTVDHDENTLKSLEVKKNDSHDDATRNTLAINNKFKSQEISFLPGRKYRITMCATSSRGKNYAREVMSIMSLTKSVKVTVITQIPDLCIYGELLSPYGFRTTQNGNRYTFTSDRPNLPFQGYMIWWHEKNNNQECPVQ